MRAWLVGLVLLCGVGIGLVSAQRPATGPGPAQRPPTQGSPTQDSPTQGWRVDTPESQGVDSAALADAVALVLRDKLPLHGLLLVRNGVLVFESYFYPYQPDVPHDVASVTKSITSMLIGIALDRGDLHAVTDAALPLALGRPVPVDDPRKARITIGNLLSMTSGLECGALNAAHTAEPELLDMRQTRDWVAYGASLPMRLEPGSRFAYCSVNNHLLAGVLRTQTGKTPLAYAQEHLFAPLQIRDARWPVDPTGLNHGWADLHLLPRDMAKLGYLYLRGGRWGDRQVISERWVRESFQPRTVVVPGVEYGYSWWINVQRTPHIPEMQGRGGQRISLVPDKQTVVVFIAGGLDTDRLAPFVLQALKSDTPLPPNPEATARLRGLLAEARRAPAPTPAAPLPDTAAKISGTTYRLASNPIDLRSFALTFGNAGARFEVAIADEVWHGPVGLEGVYAFSDFGHQRLPLGARGRWTSATEFELDLNLVANISRLLLTVRFDGQHAALHVVDTTGSIPDLDLAGTPARPAGTAAGRSAEASRKVERRASN